MKVQVHDIITVAREIELPEACPKCGVLLEGEGTEFQVIEYQDQIRHAQIEAVEDDGEVNFGWPDLPNCGDSFLYISWSCECGELLADNNEKDFKLEDAPAGIKNLLNITD
jgi:hypothetical protein